jgi:GWxTD domain-containing protein
LFRGNYQLSVGVTAGKQKVEKRMPLRITHGGDQPTVAAESLVEPLRYVTDEKEWAALTKGDNPEKALADFWKKRDPTPETTENELYNEFYRRVETANIQFGFSRQPGWNTDRGHVYIVYGAPDEIEKSSPSSTGMQVYETWYYRDIDRQFVFLDDRGFGDFRLVSGRFD